MKKIEDVLKIHTGTNAEDWFHRDGAWIHARARIGEGASIGEWATVGAWASIGEWARIGAGASIGARATALTIFGMAEFGPITAHQHQDGGWLITCGCRCFTLSGAREYWANKPSRVATLRAVEILATEAIARGWEDL